jgi:hypothetical protein
VILQSDDWGRVGVRDQDGYDQLRSCGIRLGERPYDFYSLESVEDLRALASLLSSHRDSEGNNPRLVMNFCVANLDFSAMQQNEFRKIRLLPLAHGLPGRWARPGLLEEYRAGVKENVFFPALHGLTHFCVPAVESILAENSQHADLLRVFWEAETPYIHWRMPWVGHEYSNPGSNPHFIEAQQQRVLIREACRMFEELFGFRPASACAPGYRSNRSTHRAWAEGGIRVAQNGTGASLKSLFFDEFGMLQIFRSIDFEPGLGHLELESHLQIADASFARGIPFIISIHSINFHSSLKDFRTPTLAALDDFLTSLESRYPELLYITDAELYSVATAGEATRLEPAAISTSSDGFDTLAARSGD